jgi:DNA-binding NarL/FixJ family response regulator
MHDDRMVDVRESPARARRRPKPAHWIGVAVIGGTGEVAADLMAQLAETEFVIRVHLDDCNDAVARVSAAGAEVMLLMADGDGRWLDCATLIGSSVNTPLVLIGPVDGKHFLAALRAGVVGFVTTDGSGGELVRVLEVVRRGEMAIPRAMCSVLVERIRTERASQRAIAVDGRVVDFSEREWEVLALLGDRTSTSAIADRLFISRVTVRSHVAAIVHKLGVADRAAAADLIQRHR